MTTYPWPGNLYKWCRGYFIWFFGSMSYVEDSFGRKWDKIWMAAMGGWGGGGGGRKTISPGFLLLQAWTETYQLICSSLVYFSIPTMHKPVSSELSDFNSHWRPIFHLEVSHYETPTFSMTAASPFPQTTSNRPI